MNLLSPGPACRLPPHKHTSPPILHVSQLTNSDNRLSFLCFVPCVGNPTRWALCFDPFGVAVALSTTLSLVYIAFLAIEHLAARQRHI